MIIGSIIRQLELVSNNATFGGVKVSSSSNRKPKSKLTVAGRSPLRYPGGKSRAVRTIYELLPDIKHLVSPFFGGGSVELYCATQGIKVHGADAFKPLVEFWKQALRNPVRLAEQVSKFLPLQKETFYAMQQELREVKDSMQLATKFFVLNRASFSGTTLSGGMSPGHPRFTASAIERLQNFRVKNLTVKFADYRKTIQANPDKFLYLDPPYAIKSDNLYGHRGDMHKGFDHEELAAILKSRSGWILSYNNSPEITRLYQGYDIIEPNWTYGMSNNKKSREALILSL